MVSKCCYRVGDLLVLVVVVDGNKSKVGRAEARKQDKVAKFGEAGGPTLAI
jgi:hypothetical protein